MADEGVTSTSKVAAASDGSTGIKRNTAIIPLLVLVLVTASCGTAPSGQQAGAPLPPPPGVIELEVVPPAHPDDGLFRYIVSPSPAPTPGADGALDGPDALDAPRGTGDTPGIAGEAPAGEAGEVGEDGPAGEGDRVRWAVPPGYDATGADGATLQFLNGQPGYRHADGSFVPLDGIESADDPAGHSPPADRSVAEAEGQAGAEVGSMAEAEAAAESYGHPVIDALARRDGVVSITPIGDGSFAVVTSSADVVADPALAVMEDLPLGFTDTYGPYQWPLDNTGSNLASLASPPPQVVDADVDGAEAAAAATGAGIVVAVVDSGVDFSHPDLAGASWVNDDEDCDNGIDDDANGYVDDCRGWDFAANDNVPFTPGHHAHGTHVAGIIAATAGNNEGIAGIAPDVQIMDLSVSATGSITTSAIARAIRYAADNGADVVNLSLGTSPGAPYAAVTPIVDAVHYAESRGVLLAVAAGNDGVNLDVAPVYPASIEASNMLVVGASSPSETKAGFSNYGTAVDLFAPGELIVSTMPGGDYNFMSGTSQATPIAAATAALVLEGRPEADPATVINQLVGTADELGAYAAHTPTSARLNAARAVGLQPDGATPGSADIVTVRGLATAGDGTVEAEITVNAPGGQYHQPYHWEASLVLVREDGAYALVDHPVEVDWVGATTDERGAIELGEGDSMTWFLNTSLPDGTYGLVVEAVPRTDPTVRLGDAYITTFLVGEPVATPDPDPGPDPGSGGGEDGGGVSPSPSPQPSPSPTDPYQPAPSPGDPGPHYPTPGPSPIPSDPFEPTPTDPTPTPDLTEPGDPGDADGGWSPYPSVPGAPGPAPAPGDAVDPGAGPDLEPVPGSPPPSDGSGGSSGGSGGASPDPGIGSDPGPGSGPGSDSGSDGGGGSSGGGGAVPQPAPPTGPIDVVDGEWAIHSISPRSGPTRAETFVTISGVFPREAHVWFGDLPATVYAQSSTWLIVGAPYVATPQIVDVSLRTSADGIVLMAPEAYAYVDVGGGITLPAPYPTPVPGPGEPTAPPTDPTPTPTPTDPTPTPTDPVPGPTPTDPVPPPGEPVPADPPSDGGDDTSTDDDPTDHDRTRQRQARALPAGDPVDLGNGLTGRRLEGLAAVGGVPACTSDPCRTRRISP